MYADKTVLQVVGQLLIALLFIGTGIMNAGWKQQQHVDRMIDAGIPFPWMVLWIGFAVQIAAGIMLALNWHTPVAAALLIVFTIAASAIFHRFWLVADPLRRHFHVSNLFGNAAVIGGLLLLM
ncbi:DoxX family protein [Methylocella sp. CPCC 101449]|uniref:DoxX family protein n=1 Tax=Methylocella sp. CPCC 101449 TaxID=2987531 RepID=UPI00288EF217|nr:DoxX family protein [Methylocella sp. CPCC 101449]MDT2021972.1 DoxX family protein [Methylocella sp. CPCC 101449]